MTGPVFPFLSKSARRVSDGRGPRKARQFVAAYFLRFPHSARWLSFVHALYAHHPGGEPEIDMVRVKFLRGYHSTRLSVSKRLTMLKSHYAVLEGHFRSPIVADILAGKPLPVAHIVGKDGTPYDIFVQRDFRFGFEGELTLFLNETATGQMIAALTFNFIFSPRHEVQIRIAGLQGPASEESKQLVVKTTRNLWGARPKAVILDALYALSDAMKCDDLQAVEARNHPLRDANHHMVADNDGFWSEIATGRTGQGDFVLPSQLSVRSVEDVPAKKRKDWLARQALKADIKGQVQASVMTWFRYASQEVHHNTDTVIEIAAE